MPSKRSDWHGQTHMARPTSDAGGSLRESGSKHASGKSRPEGARVSTISQRIASFVARQSAQRARVAVFSALAVVAVVLVAAALHLQALALTHGVWSLGGSASAAAAGDGSEGGVVTIGEGASDAAVEQPAPQPVDPAICRQLDARLVEGDPESESGERVVATVRADVPKDAIPEDAQLFVGLVGEEGFAPAQDAAVQAVEQKADGKVYEALPLDLSLRDAEGNEIDPGCNVTYHVSAGIVEEGADPYAVRIDGEGAAEVMEGPKPWELTGVGQEASVELQHESGESQGEGQQDEAVTELGQEEGQSAAEGQGATEGENQDSAAAEGGAQQGDATEGEQQSAPEVTFTTAGVPDVVVAVATREQTLETAGSNTFDAARLDAPAAAGVPVGSELGVIEVTEDDEAYGPCLEQLRELIGDEPYDVLLYDIGIYRGEGELQPQAAVDVSIDLSDWASELIDGARVVHFGEEGPELVDATREGDSVRFAATGFSVYAIVDVSPSSGQGPTVVSPVTSLSDLATDVAADCEFELVANASQFNWGTDDVSFTSGFVARWSNQGNYSERAYWKFEPAGTDGQYRIYTLDGNTKKYITKAAQQTYNYNINKNTYTLSLDDSQQNATVFEVDPSPGNNRFYIVDHDTGFKMTYPQQDVILLAEDDATWNLKLEIKPDVSDDPLGLDGKTYGIAYHLGDEVAAGLGVNANDNSKVAVQALRVQPNVASDESDLRLITATDDLVEWTFTSLGGGYYNVTTQVGGQTKYLTVDAGGARLENSAQEGSRLQVILGTGDDAGKFNLKSSSRYLWCRLEDRVATPAARVEDFREWQTPIEGTFLNIVQKGDAAQQDAVTNFAMTKVSISDTNNVYDGQEVVVYTREWNERDGHYDYYVVDPDGKLIPAHERADSIQWYGDSSKEYTWKFIEHTDGGNPTGYFDFKSLDSDKYLAPKGSETTSDEQVGVNLAGREAGAYSSTLLAWDSDSYEYKGLKVEDGQLVPCPKSEASPLFVAVADPTAQGLTKINTLDNDAHGITMRMIDVDALGQGGRDGALSTFLGTNANNGHEKGLLSTNLDGNGYPKTTLPNGQGNLSSLFADATQVNHLFYESSYLSNKYYEYDSTQTFATLLDETSHQPTNEFTVYRELGTNNSTGWDMDHGQFFPYNYIKAGAGESSPNNPENLLSREGYTLPDSDPRKYEQLHRLYNQNNQVNAPDNHFAMELSASFVQTPDGTDDLGHDSIFEFQGDDDFWLYVDNELVIDLGGIHGALNGSINFRNGQVMVNGNQTTLVELFRQNYIARGLNPDDAYDLFVQNDSGEYVFKPYTSHTMRIFYMERGAGAANLYMRFNLTTATEDKIRLSKEIEGLDPDAAKLAEFAYRVYYTLEGDSTVHWLANDDQDPNGTRAYYKDTTKPVPYEPSLDIDGITYNNVYLLKNGDTADITFPLQPGEKIASYGVVECGVDTNVYTQVDVNGQEVTGTDISGHQNRKDFNSGEATIADRAMVAYKNKANPDALHDLTFTKKLFRADGTTPISYANDQQGFDLRLYLSPETRDLAPANAYPYHVLDADGNYCAWSGTGFESLNQTVFDDLTEPEKAQATFLTSPNGAVSQIPADHTVQVRNLPEDTKVQVEERTGEVPTGYEFIKYKKDDADYNGDPFTIQGSTNVEVHNKKLGKTVSIKKVDVSSTSTVLPGAVFDLYVVNDGTPEQTPLISGLTSDANGLLAKGSATTFDLSAGTYQLVETEAPAGYIKWKDPATITIKYVNESDGSALIDPNDDAVAYYDGTAYSQSGLGRSFDSNSKVYTVSVTNTGGAELPHAGGPGEGLAYALGTLLIVAGLLMYVRRGQPA